MKARTKIPELESKLEQNKQRRWTPEIERTLLDYYTQFAYDNDLKSLAAYLNERFDRSFTSVDITSHYHKMPKQ